MEVLELFNLFFYLVDLDTSILKPFLFFIPKTIFLVSLDNFWLVSLLIKINKLISKVLAASIALVIHSIIAPSQLAFIWG